jgi:fucose permease
MTSPGSHDMLSNVDQTVRRPPVVAAYAAFVLVGISAGVGGVLLPAQIVDYAVDKATVGLTFFSFSAGFMLAGATAGPLLHHIGTRRALVLGAGLFATAGIYTGVRPPFVVYVIVVQTVMGYGIGLLESVLNAFLSTQSDATTLLNRLHAFFGVGALLGPVLAAWMLTSVAWTTVLLALGLACVPLVAIFGTMYPTQPVATHAVDAAYGEAPPLASRGLLSTALHDRGVLLGAVFLAVYVGLEIGVGTWGFSLMVGHYGQKAVLAGYTISGYWLGLTVGRFVISPIARRFGMTAANMTTACLIGVAASVALAWVAPDATLAGVGLALLGFFLGPIFPTTMSLVPRLASSRLVPTAIGVINGFSVIGGAVCSWLAGAIAQGVGVWTLLPFALALALVLLAIWWRLARRITII